MYSLVKAVKRYRNAYTNWLEVMFSVAVNHFPVIAVRRKTKSRIKLSNSTQARILSFGENLNFDDSAKLGIRMHGRSLILEPNNDNYGDVLGVFINQEYNELRPERRVILDIGASVGDSSLWFAANGAEKVIAVEPSIGDFKSLCNNITANGFVNVILPLWAGVGAMDNTAHIAKNAYGVGNTISANDVDISSMLPLKILSLEEITRQFGLNRYFLKMDCEGCEYDVLPRVSDSVLKSIEEAQIEYHDGIRDLRSRFESAGFVVKIIPNKRIGLIERITEPDSGYIIARRMTDNARQGTSN